MIMKQGWILGILVMILTLSGCSVDKAYTARQKRKVYPLEQIDFHFMVDRYLNKDESSVATIEGIYSVSSVVTKKGRGFVGPGREKVKDQEEHYSKVAIIRDDRNPEREYIEVSLNKENLPSFSIVGEFKELSESNLLMYKHFEARGKSTSYTFSYDKVKDILEGVRVESVNSAIITYKLTYVKLEPKAKSKTINY
jgi:hypothetical protein